MPLPDVALYSTSYACMVCVCGTTYTLPTHDACMRSAGAAALGKSEFSCDFGSRPAGRPAVEFDPQPRYSVHYRTEHLCRGPEDLPRANAQALGKDKHTATIILCRGLSPRQRAGPRQHRLTRRPSPAVNLCRGHHR